MSEAAFTKWLLDQVPAIVISMVFIWYLIKQVTRLEKLLEGERDYSRNRDEQDRLLIIKLTGLIEDLKNENNRCNTDIVTRVEDISKEIKSHIDLMIAHLKT